MVLIKKSNSCVGDVAENGANKKENLRISSLLDKSKGGESNLLLAQDPLFTNKE